MWWKFIQQALLLLLPLIILELFFDGMFFYLGVDPSNWVEVLKFLFGSLASLSHKLTSGLVHAYDFVGIRTDLRASFVSYTRLVIMITIGLTVLWLDLKLLQYQARTLRKIIALWKNRKAAPQ